MKIAVESIRDPRWANEERTRINCFVKFTHLKEQVPFTADPNDSKAHGREMAVSQQLV